MLTIEPPPVGDHVRDRGLTGEERRPHVDRHRLVEQRLRDARVCPGRHHAGVVDEHVEPAQPRQRLGDHARARAGLAEVDDALSTAVPSGRARTVASSSGPIAVDGEQARSLPVEGLEEAAPDTARGPRHDHGPVREATSGRAVRHHAAWIFRQASSHLS